MANKRNQNAKFEIKEGQLIISIGLEAIKRSIECDTNLIVDDDIKAALSIKSEISFEEENGRTCFALMLAEAATAAYENGEEGFKEISN